MGNPSNAVGTRSSIRNICNNLNLLSQIEPKNIHGAKNDEYWIISMEEK